MEEVKHECDMAKCRFFYKITSGLDTFYGCDRLKTLDQSYVWSSFDRHPDCPRKNEPMVTYPDWGAKTEKECDNPPSDHVIPKIKCSYCEQEIKGRWDHGAKEYTFLSNGCPCPQAKSEYRGTLHIIGSGVADGHWVPISSHEALQKINKNQADIIRKLRDENKEMKSCKICREFQTCDYVMGGNPCDDWELE